MVYFPKGEIWIDYWTKEEYKGGQNIIKETPLDICPIFIKGGAVIPIGKEQNYIGEKQADKLTVEVYLCKGNTETKYHHYIDDGESFKYQAGEFNNYKIKVINNEKVEIKFTVIDHEYDDKYENIEFILHNLNGEAVEVVNGKAIISNPAK